MLWARGGYLGGYGREGVREGGRACQGFDRFVKELAGSDRKLAG